jgi:hypothetical protein
LAGCIEPPAREGRKAFFFEKRSKKLCYLGVRQPGRTPEWPKVFWFFFSKKNCFLSFWVLMSAESDLLHDQIKQSIALLRRHL